MPTRRNRKWTCYLLFAAALLLAPTGAIAAGSPPATPGAATADANQGEAQAAAPAAPQLSNSDCIKCHPVQVKEVLSMGGAHLTKVTCMDCHVGHPPAVANNIPKCSKCHQGKSHFELKGCRTCHSKPHTPLELTLPSAVSKPCLTCHTDQNSQLQKHKSAHSQLGCTTCHRQHGPPPKCLECHDPHVKGQTMKDCISCHKAHMPLRVTYKKDIPSKFCAACHAKEYQQLTAGSTKHAKLACAFCHQERHGMVPKCTGCHGIPHPKGIMSKFKKCGDCHGIAHNLNK